MAPPRRALPKRPAPKAAVAKNREGWIADGSSNYCDADIWLLRGLALCVRGCGVNIVVGDDPNVSAVLPAFCVEYSRLKNHRDGTMGHQKAKPILAQKAFPKMTAARIRARDPEGEVLGWFQRIGEMAG